MFPLTIQLLINFNLCFTTKNKVDSLDIKIKLM